MMFVIRYAILLSCLVVLSLSPAVYADIAPASMTGGRALEHMEKENDRVRMVKEDVLVRIFGEGIETVARFLMFNEGDELTMEVGFPYNYQDEFVEFRAFVDGEEVELREGSREIRFRSKVSVQYWKLWTMTFEGGASCEVRVEYRTNCLEHPDIVKVDERFSSLPDELRVELDSLTTRGRAEYILRTGKSWKGRLDSCRVEFRLEGRSGDHIRKFWPKDGTLTDNGVVWEYTDYEPAGHISLYYYPNKPANEIPPYLAGIVERYPDDPRIASQIGEVLRGSFGRVDMRNRIYHDFLAGWDGTVPRLLMRGRDGKCRYSHEHDGHFYTAWRMGNVLLDHYRREDRLGDAVDIAPKIVGMSSAIVDSLESCGGLTETARNTLKAARALRDLAEGIVQSH